MSDDSVDRREFIGLVGALGLGGLASETVVATPSRPPDPARDELLVGVQPDAQMADVRSTTVSTASADVQVTHRNEALEYFAVEVPEGASDEARERIKASLSERSGVDYVEENRTVETMLAPNDPRYDGQYAPDQVNAPAAWETTTGSGDVTIAIVDTGAEYDHEDLTDRYADDPGYDFVDDDEDPYPDAGAEHGTHVSGCASADTDNDVGTAGVSDSTLINCRALGGDGRGNLAAVADAIQYSADRGADIINMSLGGGFPTRTMKSAVRYAADRDCLIVCSAGNAGMDRVSYPAKFDECVAVTALDPDENLAYFSNYGSDAEVAAPGVNVLAPLPDDGYGPKSGTSMAAPVAAGVAALGAAAHPDLSASELREKLRDTAKDVGLSGDKQGAGRVDAAAIVEGGDGNAAPEASFSVDPNYVTVGEVASFDASSSSDDGSITSYEWTFGDGETASGESVEHTFSDPGDYEVTLTVTDDADRSEEAVEAVSVVPEADETVIVAPDNDNAFDPSSLTVEPGTTVRFEWDAGGHTLTVESQPDGADWNGAPEEHDAGYVHTNSFETTGEYGYYCDVHPDDMQGTVIVEDGADCQTVPEAVAGEDGTIGDAELLQAIQYWREGTEVPGTCGETVDDSTLLDLIESWRTGETV